MLLFSCSKENNLKAIGTAELKGSWKWISTDGGIGNNIHETPASTGQNILLTFTSESNYNIYTNNVLTATGTYTLSARNCIHDHIQKTVVDFNSPNVGELMMESLVNGMLTVSDEAYDGLTGVYTKVD